MGVFSILETGLTQWLVFTQARALGLGRRGRAAPRVLAAPARPRRGPREKKKPKSDFLFYHNQPPPDYSGLA